jgi:hypothetical protein
LSGSPFEGRSFFLETPGLGREPLAASYDDDADVLYLWRGQAPVEAISFPMDDGPIVRVHPETGELVGVTLLDFSACWSNRERIDLDVPPVGASEPEAPETRANEHRQLVLA